MVVPIWILCKGQIDLFKNYSYLIGLRAKKKKKKKKKKKNLKKKTTQKCEYTMNMIL